MIHFYEYSQFVQYYTKNGVSKSINFPFQFQQMNETTIYEKSMHLKDSDNCLKQLLMSCIIYSAQYYPRVEGWLNQIIKKCCCTSDYPILVDSIFQLAQDIFRQVIYGPSACYVSVGDRPHNQHLNTCFILTAQTEKSNLVQISRQMIKNSWLCQYLKQEQIQQILWYRRSNYLKLTNFVNKKCSKQVLKQLQINGESWVKVTPLANLFLILQKTISLLISYQVQKVNHKLYLLDGRLSFLHNKILQNPSKQLADRTLTSYRKYIKILNTEKNYSLTEYISLILEYSQVLVFYYKYSQAKRIIQFSKNIAGLHIEFTGKMGRRTKFQTFDTPQLIMNIKNKSDINQDNSQQKPSQQQQQFDGNEIEMPNAKQLVLKQTKNIKKGQQSNIQSVEFNDDNILLQKPKYVNQQQQSIQMSVMSIDKLLVALAVTQYTWDTSPKQQMLYQKIATSVHTILEYKQLLSYPLNFNALLLRSLNQFPRTKNTERALEQLQKLKSKFNQKTQKNVQFLFSSSYVCYFDFIKILAHKYIDIGMTMTAIQIYQKLGMLQQCIDGLIAKNYKQKAITLALKYQKDYGKTPRLLCMLGDLQNNDKCVQFYQQAWKLSEFKNARCQRSLGWHYFAKKQYEKAVSSFKKATQANFYHPNTWFTLGCCYMQLKDFQKAVQAFGQSVCIDETQGQAWGNIATCYIYQNKYKQAYSTLEQALKYSQRNWKMWSNMLSVSLKLKKFYKFFQSIQKLVNLQKSDIVTYQSLKQIIKIFQYQQASVDRRRSIQAMKNRIDRLYKLIIQRIGQNPIVWRSIYQYNIELQKYTIQNYKHYKKSHQQNKLDKNDILQGYENYDQIEKNVRQSLHQVKQNIVSSKQTQLNMNMKIGWETNKKQSEKVLQVLKEYIDVFKKYGPKDQKSINQYHLFVKGLSAKLQSCLQRTIQLQP